MHVYIHRSKGLQPEQLCHTGMNCVGLVTSFYTSVYHIENCTLFYLPHIFLGHLHYFLGLCTLCFRIMFIFRIILINMYSF